MKMKYAPEPVMDTGNMTDDEFGKARQGLGGSDAGIICGKSKFKSPQQLWAEKTGKDFELSRKRPSNAYIFAAGHALEEGVARLFLYKFREDNPNINITMSNDTMMYRDGRKNEDGSYRYPFAFVNLDRRLTIFQGAKKYEGILECKTMSYMNHDKIALVQAGIVPPDYECQIRFYMAVMNLDFAYIAFLWGTTPNDIAYIMVARDYEIEKRIFANMEYFWACVQNDVEPATEDLLDPGLLSDYYTSKYGVVDDKKEPVEIDSRLYADQIKEAYELDCRIDDLKRQLEDAEEERTKVFNAFYPVLGNTGVGFVKLPDGRKATLTQKSQMTRPKLDIEKLKADHADLVAQYSTAFDEKAFKKDYPLEAKKYMTKAELKPDGVNSFTLKFERDTNVMGYTIPVKRTA